MLIVWGERDHTIPIEHGRAAHRALPNSIFRTLPDAAHFPNLEDPEGLASALLEFIAATDPVPPDALSDWGSVLEGRAPRSRRAGGALV
jgi:hypothetical protein